MKYYLGGIIILTLVLVCRSSFITETSISMRNASSDISQNATNYDNSTLLPPQTDEQPNVEPGVDVSQNISAELPEIGNTNQPTDNGDDEIDKTKSDGMNYWVIIAIVAGVVLACPLICMIGSCFSGVSSVWRCLCLPCRCVRGCCRCCTKCCRPEKEEEKEETTKILEKEEE